MNNKIKSADKKRLPLWSKILIGILIAVILLGGIAYGVFTYYYHQMNIKGLEDNDTPAAKEYFDTDENTGNLEELDPNSIHLDSAESVSTNKDVINILLCGEESIGGGRGRTDSIMIATINQKDNQLKLTSIMRDSYVQIPGFSDNKINAAYHNGGMKTLIKTIKKNFGIAVDGYVLVNFDSFQKIVDAVGGIDITLDEQEVKYLNSTNYISDTSNHTLTVGKNHMNGNQALGCECTTINKLLHFIDTLRQRIRQNDRHLSGTSDLIPALHRNIERIDLFVLIPHLYCHRNIVDQIFFFDIGRKHRQDLRYHSNQFQC